MPRLIAVAIMIVLLPLPAAWAQQEPFLLNRPTACINAYGKGSFSDALIECALAAHDGNAEAMTYMGGMYYKGEGVEKSYAEAFNWYKQAADRGWADAEFSLAKMYEKGYGVTVDYDTAFEYLKKAAAQDHLFATYNIGYFYGKGYVGGAPDYAKAATWFEKAANRHHALAMYALASLAMVGKGVEHDLAKALMWAKLAAKYGVVEAHKMQEQLQKIMQPEDSARAEKLADEWAKAHP